MTTQPRGTTALSVRAALPADAATLARFNVALAEETEALALSPETVLAGVEAVLEDPAKGLYWVAEIEGTVVGQLMLTYEWSDWRNGFFWWIQSVYVEPSSRRRGVFKALFEKASQQAADEPMVCGLRLYVAQDNDRAQQTYLDLGMQRVEYQVFELFVEKKI